MLYPGSIIKSLIIEALVENSGLNAKELKTSIEKEGKVRFSLQAIYKALNNLCLHRITLKFKDTYCLSPFFRESIKRAAANLEKYTVPIMMESIVEKIENGEKIEQKFKSPLMGINFARDIITGLLLATHPEKVTIYRFFCHFGILALGQQSTLIQYPTDIEYEKHYFIYGDSAVDKEAVKILIQNGYNVKRVTSRNCHQPNTMYYIANDYVVGIQEPESYLRKYDKMLEKTPVEEHPTPEFMAFLKGEGLKEKTIVTIEKNPEKAKFLIQAMKELK